MAALKAGNLKILRDKAVANTSSFSIQSGFVEVIHNNVTVLVEGAVPVDRPA